MPELTGQSPLQGAMGLTKISRDQASRLREENPKGKLLELCARYRIPPPEFEAAAHLSGHARRGALRSISGEPLWSSWFLAQTVKEAEQAACVELLALALAWLDGAEPDLAEAPGPEAAARGKNPKARLNELKQRGELEDFGFEVLSQEGPSHEPRFSVRCWVQRGGQRHPGPPFSARSKREAETLAAADMVPLVEPLLGASAR